MDLANCFAKGWMSGENTEKRIGKTSENDVLKSLTTPKKTTAKNIAIYSGIDGVTGRDIANKTMSLF